MALERDTEGATSTGLERLGWNRTLGTATTLHREVPNLMFPRCVELARLIHAYKNLTGRTTQEITEVVVKTMRLKMTPGVAPSAVGAEVSRWFRTQTEALKSAKVNN